MVIKKPLNYSIAFAILCHCVFIAGIMLLPLRTRGDEETCIPCGEQVEISGQFAHCSYPDNATLKKMSPANESAFTQEIAGHNFTVSISHLPAGKYIIAIGEAEQFFKQPGQRLFDVTCGDTVLAKNVDIVAAAGGPNKVCSITGVVEHPDESVPLKINFTARKNDAKFNTIDIKDASGATLISLQASDLARSVTTAASKIPAVSGPKLWKDPTQPINSRVNDLIRRMSLAEKVQELRNDAPAIPRLGLPAYNYWNECLHGVARAGIATVFPQAIGMAATWDTPLIHQEAHVIAVEARAKHNEYTRTHDGNSAQYYGLTFWTPNINIFRDPRWGRGQETYGEDPFLTARMAVAFITGLQGDNPKYLEAIACAKHFAVHSGPEPERHHFDVSPSARDLYETYLPQFEAAVREGHVGGVMGAYNALYGVPDCANAFLLTDLLRKQWGFDGYVTSDCGAIYDIWANHKYVNTPEEAAADAIKAGDDLCCGTDYNALTHAVQEGLVSEAQIDQALRYVLETRFRLGLFDPPAMVPFAKIPISENNSRAHRALALRVARESMVLLKNEGLLPLDRTKIKRIAVIGMNANSVPVLLGDYNGTPSNPVTILDGIKDIAGPNIDVVYEPGCPLAFHRGDPETPNAKMTAQAVAAARSADVVIYVGGISAQLEGEEMSVDYDGFRGGDRTRIELPYVQMDLLKALYATGKPIVFVNCSGGAIAMPWAAKNLPAILQAWYPGEEGGRAVAEVLFGLVNPAGRLPVTFYDATSDLPPFEDYSMSNRTYRYYDGTPLFAFGHGLSYTKFSYSKLSLDDSIIAPDGTVKISFNLKNIGLRDGDEVAQIYFRHVHSKVQQPREALCGFTRVHIKHGKTANVTADIPVKRFRYWDATQKQYVVEPGKYEILVGAASDDIRLHAPLKIVVAR